ncbi:MAG TPA: hypothetical protein VFJ61_10130 [Solirubrobacterales bacterium]|nr:hypothetical protein [Solirubrobacterales bacterium]
MRLRARLAALGCAAAAVLAMPALAGAADKGGELKLSTFKLKVSNGYEVEVLSVREGRALTSTVAVLAHSGPLRASYEVRAPGAGIHATFGALGQVDVAFKKRQKVVDKPERGCRWINEEGSFRGSFHFVGEGGYVTADAVDPEGEVLRWPDGICGLGLDNRVARPLLGLERTTLEARSSVDGRVLTFGASNEEVMRSISFNVSLSEEIDGMKILRTASIPGAKRTFTSTGSSRARVSPPPPFLGSAKFRDPAKGPASWVGSLSLSLPGAPDTALTGDSFVAKLCPGIGILARCLKGSRYGSGSHSQPLALARLSSLR